MSDQAVMFEGAPASSPAPLAERCAVCGADVRPVCHVRWGEQAWCYDCVTVVRVGGRTSVQARF